MTLIGGEDRVEAGERRSEKATREQLKELRLWMGRDSRRGAEAQGGAWGVLLAGVR